MKRLTLLVIVLCLTSCKTVPDHLFTPCNASAAKNQTVEEAVRVANERLMIIERCNAQIAELKKLLKK